LQISLAVANRSYRQQRTATISALFVKDLDASARANDDTPWLPTPQLRNASTGDH
jgi:hypothetical protein